MEGRESERSVEMEKVIGYDPHQSIKKVEDATEVDLDAMDAYLSAEGVLMVATKEKPVVFDDRKSERVTGADVIRWIEESHAEDKPVRVDVYDQGRGSYDVAQMWESESGEMVIDIRTERNGI